MFTFRSDIPGIPGGWPPWAEFAVAACLAGCSVQDRLVWHALSCGDLVTVPGSPAVSRRGACGGQVGEGLAAPAAGPGRQAGRGASGVVVLAGVPGDQDPLVADGQQAGEPERERGQAGEPGPAAGDVVAGGVLGGGEGPFGAGAP